MKLNVVALLALFGCCLGVPTTYIREIGNELQQVEFQPESPEGTAYTQWQNAYDGPLHVACGDKEAFYRVRSQHDNRREDRQWEWFCKPAAEVSLGHCTWSGYVNDYDELINFHCPPNQVLAGVSSEHANRQEDRKWKFRCCGAAKYYTRSCYTTRWINDWDAHMDFSVGTPKVFTGVYSRHDNHREDRRWQITVCDFIYYDKVELQEAEHQLESPEGTAYTQWQNDWDGRLEVSCRDQEAFYKVRSQHDNGKEDRRWEWLCRSTTHIPMRHCTWTDYVNDWDKPIFFHCPANQVLTGVYSEHANRQEDRRWKFRCCGAENYYTRNCYKTDWINDWDDPMDFSVGAPKVFTGVYSRHDNGKEDRRWQIAVCDFPHCSPVG